MTKKDTDGKKEMMAWCFSIVLHIQHRINAARSFEGVPGMVGSMPVLPGSCHSFLCEAEVVATWTAGCELQSPARAQTATSFYIVNNLECIICISLPPLNHYQRNLSGDHESDLRPTPGNKITPSSSPQQYNRTLS